MSFSARTPRTRHMEGSGGRPLSMEDVSWASLAGRPLVVEEKADGQEITLWFEEGRELPLMASRNSPVGPGEGLLTSWAAFIGRALRERIGTRYAVTGMWMERLHAIYYDRLPHLFWECDLRDRSSGDYLDTTARRAILGGVLEPVPVLYQGATERPDELTDLLGPSRAASPTWQSSFADSCRLQGVDPEVAASWITGDDQMEGLYIKREEDSRVVGRYKWVRSEFLETIARQDGHWSSRQRVSNRLARPDRLWET